MSRYDELAEATRLLLEQELDAHRRNLEQSRRIDGELAQLDAMRKAAQSDPGAITARQILGADTLWQGWLARKRQEMLRQAARARAQELMTLDRARLAFSRTEAADTIRREAKMEAIRKSRTREADAMEALGQLRIAMRRAEDGDEA
jgi:hypothetical protein